MTCGVVDDRLPGHEFEVLLASIVCAVLSDEDTFWKEWTKIGSRDVYAVRLGHFINLVAGHDAK